MITGTLLIAILVNGNPSFTAQEICAVNRHNLSAECVTAHRTELKLSPGIYNITVDGKKSSVAEVKPRKVTTVYLSK